MSCDNIQGNGDVAHKMITAFARLQDADLADWIEREVPFPNSMVDRITPVTSDDDRQVLAERFGVEDDWPVVCEPFTQWVLEDRFVDGRPPFDEVGVQVVDDVEPYELMKLRLLNASHQALCYLGYLAGYRYAHEVCQDRLFADFLLAYMDREATPTLGPVPGVDLDAYKPGLIERFANPEVRDTLARLCAESSDRIPKWLLPVVRRNLADGGEIERSALVVAAWARYAEGVDEQGEPIEVVDRLAEQLVATAKRQRDEPLAFLEDRDLFGDLIDDERFTPPTGRRSTRCTSAGPAPPSRTGRTGSPRQISRRPMSIPTVAVRVEGERPARRRQPPHYRGRVEEESHEAVPAQHLPARQGPAPARVPGADHARPRGRQRRDQGGRRMGVLRRSAPAEHRDRAEAQG